jgi:hypothetical protein
LGGSLVLRVVRQRRLKTQGTSQLSKENYPELALERPVFSVAFSVRCFSSFDLGS